MANLYIYKNEKIEEIKCYGCGWRYSRLFFTAKNDKEAEEVSQALDRQYLEDEENDAVALCAECMCEIFVEEKYQIESKEG